MVVEIATEDKLEYKFFPVQTNALKFRVRAGNDAHIALTTGPTESNPMYEIFIGGWGNTRFAIRKNRDKPDVVEHPFPNCLNANEFRSFWLTFYDNIIALGLNEECTPLLIWSDPQLFPVTYFGIRTGWGSSGSWIIEDTWPGWRASSVPIGNVNVGWNVGSMSGAGTWVSASGGSVPPNAVPGGFDNEQLYIGRAQFTGATIPGKVVPSHGVCYVPWGGSEHGVADYEVLCDCGGRWERTSCGEIPPNAVPAGSTEDGEPLYIGRAQHNDTVTLGKVQKSHGVCYIPYGGQEISINDYEVFVL